MIVNKNEKDIIKYEKDEFEKIVSELTDIASNQNKKIEYYENQLKEPNKIPIKEYQLKLRKNVFIPEDKRKKYLQEKKLKEKEIDERINKIKEEVAKYRH